MSFGGGGGDGGAQVRADQEKARRDAAIKQINQYFGIPDLTPVTTTTAPARAAPQPRSTDTGSGSVDRNVNVGQQYWGGSAPAGLGTPAAKPTTTTVTPTSDPVAERNKAAREALYGKTRQDVINLGNVDLTKQTNDAQRGLDFFLARKGLTGGSVNVDKGAELQNDAAKGATRVYQSGVSAENSLRTADENARQNAINTILGGADAGTAMQNATNALAQNARDVAGRDYGGAVGDAFSSLDTILGERARVNAAQSAADKYKAAGLSQPTGTYGTVKP